MIRIQITTDTAGPALDRLAAALSDLTPVMQQIGEYLVQSTRDRFPTGRAPDGSPWVPKSQVTLARQAKEKRRPDPRPLYGIDGYLSKLFSYDAGPASVEWGSALPYAGTMQFGAAQGAFGRTSRGGPIPWGPIPARPFIGLSPEDEAAIVRIVGEALTRAAAG